MYKLFYLIVSEDHFERGIDRFETEWDMKRYDRWMQSACSEAGLTYISKINFPEE